MTTRRFYYPSTPLAWKVYTALAEAQLTRRQAAARAGLAHSVLTTIIGSTDPRPPQGKRRASLMQLAIALGRPPDYFLASTPGVPPRLGTDLALARLARGWHQTDLERVAGVDQTIISRTEARPTYRPSVATQERLAAAVGLPLTSPRRTPVACSVCAAPNPAGTRYCAQCTFRLPD